MATNLQTHSQNRVEQVVSDYLDVCNKAFTEKTNSFLYERAKRLRIAFWGDSYFRTLVYDQSPRDVVGDCTIHLDAENRTVELAPGADHDVAFTWKAPLAYLEDVARRPQWYLERPFRLHSRWVSQRAGDALTEHRWGVAAFAVAAGFALGATAVALSSRRDAAS